MQRPPRTRKPTKRAKAVAETEQLINEICDPKVAKKRKRNAVQLIALEPKAARQLRKEDLSDYEPPLYLRKFPSRPLLHPQTELEAFRLFITHEIVEILVQNTNSYAENEREELPFYPRATPWFPTTTTEIWCYMGCLFYMGLHQEILRTSYWSDTHRLGRWMSRHRFN
jgi:hypothetical protein